ncbi:cytosolic regulator Pianissimo, putative [Talaromyces stipitatus ATCC 10500]|uniref:Cytosolic regulator Pianissimo, putative n=1 Tax=Talaromyces stipitatus (strain ATCC 10500 / CBS 375.48 / QM 6759 / NRRL 1006) TaxID=441959 RepID=B8M8L1_TALSN|nr:cytosolic regulator Pianissimo, putative [Talaromyces stipitatus ATCC 10500]EED20524.1 cytosolic regulator Pianissimo, putative [Talaromyces stipitatus ATCC 10500]
MASAYNTGNSATPTQPRALGNEGKAVSRSQDDGGATSWNDAASRSTRNGRSGSGGSSSISTRGGASLAPSAQPGSFSSELKSMQNSRSVTPRQDAVSPFPRLSNTMEEDEPVADTTEQRQAAIRDKIAKEMKIKVGTENMLEALLTKNAKQTRDQRLRVESELSTSNRKLAELRQELEDELLRAQTPSTPQRSRLSALFRGSPMRSPSRATDSADENMDDADGETESPTYVLAETLQALELEGMAPDYYIERANSLVELFKRHPTLKYDLEWSVFGQRVQMMLLSDSREVVAAGYRLTRYAIADRASIRTIRRLHTDELVTLSLVKESKASIEREQALKFVRAFLDVKDGVHEISRAVVRTIVSVAEHHEDRLRNISIMTLAEILIKDPGLIAYAGGIGPLHDALAEGTFSASESLIGSFLHIMDTPHRRQYLHGGRELEAVLCPFTDSFSDTVRSGRLKCSAKAISAMLKTWPGLLVLARDKSKPLQSLLESLNYPDPTARDLILELLFDALQIKPPSWSSSFLAGRRLTTYGRVTNLRSESDSKQLRIYQENDKNRFDLTAHFSALVLATLLEADLVKALSGLIEVENNQSLKRKATLLLTEVLKLAQHSLPQSVSFSLQVLPSLLPAAVKFDVENHEISTSTIYQIESINRILARSGSLTTTSGRYAVVDEDISASLLSGEFAKNRLNPAMDEAQFRNHILETQVLNTVNYVKWKWDLILRIIEGPLTNPKRLEEAIKGSKFMKRLIGFYRPFKYRFCMIPNTKPNQRYVRTGCALLRTLMQTPEGIKYLADNKLLRQIAECLAQVDRMSGLTSASPLFSREQMASTLSGGYFALLGVLSSDTKGIAMMERWHMANMFYHIIELKDRTDLIQALLGNMDFTLESHLRVLLSKALTAGTKDIRIFATKLLRKYAVGHHLAVNNVVWVVQMLVTQLYDPDISVCEIAVKILEEACNQREYLEYVVKCRPSLDHLGEIGAPLLLRFLSTSVGYHYLDGLDYITQEMDDWFLGRNDAYVALVEASLSRAYVDHPRRQTSSFAPDDIVEMQDIGVVPPHFYRELARTSEGCKLLEQSGHFLEFASTIRDFDLSEEDPEALLKVKGCLWAVGNVGSMELGAPFLEETEIVQDIVNIAEKADVITMRGTAFFVLGLISRSQHGLEMVYEAGWDAAVDQRGGSLGLCLPRRLEKLYHLSFAPHKRNQELKRISQEIFKTASTDPDPTNQRILKLIIDMGNTVLSKRAANDLQGIKSKHPDQFRQVELFQKTLTILESHHFRLPARRFALDLFDKSVMRRMVLEEDEDSYSESDS